MADKERRRRRRPTRPTEGRQGAGGRKARAEKAAAAKAKAAAQEAAARPARRSAREPEPKVTPRLRTHFDEVVRKKLTEQFGYKNPMQVPRIDKIVLNMGVGEAVADRKKVEQAAAAIWR